MLLPTNKLELAAVWELIYLITGKGGFAWNRRVMMFTPLMQLDQPIEMIKNLALKYGYCEIVAESAPQKVLRVLGRIGSLLNEQAKCGKFYIVGNNLTVLDIAWAVFSSMLLPLPKAVNAMPAGIRDSYTLNSDLMIDVDSILIEHRDYIYKNHLTLPLDY
jgi:glutathione S-transferase